MAGHKKRKVRKDKKIDDLEIIKKDSVKLLEEDILDSPEVENTSDEEKEEESCVHRDMIEQIMFKLPCVSSPLIGTPKQVQKKLDSLVKKMQREPDNEEIFNVIHLYIHGYLINVVLKKFPFIKGYQTVDVYQETLIALRFKAIPNFKRHKGMSFLNFAKMCIKRHLITLLNMSKNRKKDQSINQAISLDSSPSRDNDSDDKTTYANIIADNKPSADKNIERSEAYEVTKSTLLNSLSGFERVVLKEYLSSSSYKEMSKNISLSLKYKYNTKSIDNALLRIRKKAEYLMKYGRPEELPIFLTQKNT